MTDLERILERMAKHLENEVIGIEDPELYNDFLIVLRRLLPLLELAEHIADVTTETFDEWRAAKQKALEP